MPRSSKWSLPFRYSHPSLTDDSIHWHFHSMSKYPNDHCRLVKWWLAMRVHNGMFTSSFTSASHSGSVLVQSYQCSLFLITLCNFLKKISRIMGPITCSCTLQTVLPAAATFSKSTSIKSYWLAKTVSGNSYISDSSLRTWQLPSEWTAMS
jgi:hypothetical protein